MGIMTSCEDCGNRFDSCDLTKVCPACRLERDTQFDKIREFLRDNPGSRIEMVCEQMGISKKVIRYFLKKERLEIIENNGNHFLTCESCGTPLQTGRLCATCLAKENVGKSLYAAPKPSDTGGGAHFRIKQ